MGRQHSGDAQHAGNVFRGGLAGLTKRLFLQPLRGINLKGETDMALTHNKTLQHAATDDILAAFLIDHFCESGGDIFTGHARHFLHSDAVFEAFRETGSVSLSLCPVRVAPAGSLSYNPR